MKLIELLEDFIIDLLQTLVIIKKKLLKLLMKYGKNLKKLKKSFLNVGVRLVKIWRQIYEKF